MRTKYEKLKRFLEGIDSSSRGEVVTTTEIGSDNWIAVLTHWLYQTSPQGKSTNIRPQHISDFLSYKAFSADDILYQSVLFQTNTHYATHPETP